MSPMPVASIVTRFLRILVPLAIVGTAQSVFAQGMVRIHPTAVLLEGAERTATVTLTNTGDTTETYRFSFEPMRMTATGDLVKADPPLPEERFADSMLRYAPRQVTLGPGKSQVVRFRLSKPAGLEAGEYRSHFYVRPVPSQGKQRSIETPAPTNANQINFHLTPRISVSIPILVRHGQLSAEVTLSDLRLDRSTSKEAPDTLVLNLNRSGNRSVWGEAIASFTPNGGKEQVVGKTLLTLMAPTPQLIVKIPLEFEAGKTQKGNLRVVFQEAKRKGVQSPVEASLPIQ